MVACAVGVLSALGWDGRRDTYALCADRAPAIDVTLEPVLQTICAADTQPKRAVVASAVTVNFTAKAVSAAYPESGALRTASVHACLVLAHGSVSAGEHGVGPAAHSNNPVTHRESCRAQRGHTIVVTVACRPHIALCWTVHPTVDSCFQPINDAIRAARAHASAGG